MIMERDEKSVGFGRGLEIYSLPVALPADRFQIIGSEFSQVLEINVAPGEELYVDPGSMMHMSSEVKANVDYQDCGQAFTRCCCSGENFFRLLLKNQSNEFASIGLASPFPGSIVPVDVAQYSGLRFSNGAFIAATNKNIFIKLKFVQSVTVGCCGGQGFFLNELYGSDGWVFLNGGGTIMVKQLGVNEEIVVDTSSVLAFDRNVQYEVRLAGNFLTICCGGSGLFNTVFRGPGTVWLHSMSKQKFLTQIRREIGGGDNSRGNNNNPGQ